MSTLLLSALSGSRSKGSITLSANHFITFVFSCQSSQSWFDLDGSSTTTSKSEDEMESRFLLDVVITQGSAIFQLLSCKDESLLVRRNTFLILNLSPISKLANEQPLKMTYLTLSMVSLCSTSKVIVLPVRVLTKICIFAVFRN